MARGIGGGVKFWIEGQGLPCRLGFRKKRNVALCSSSLAGQAVWFRGGSGPVSMDCRLEYVNGYLRWAVLYIGAGDLNWHVAFFLP
jgi:hypothetical protein